MKKILIINPFGVGDVLFSTPLVRALKRAYPDSSIDYVCNKRAYGIIKDNPQISGIHIFEKDDYRKLWKESKLRCLKALYGLLKTLDRAGYDVAIDMSLGYQCSLLLAAFTHIRRRIGFNYRDRGKFLTDKIMLEGFNGKHVIEYYLDLGRPLGIDVSDKCIEVCVADEDRRWAERFLAEHGINKDDCVCGIIPGCGASWGRNAKYRRWLPSKFAEVADYAAERYDCKIAIFGDEREKLICDEVDAKMKARPVTACGKTSLGQFAALLDRCDLIVTNDGGPLHIAVGLKKRTISIFGPVDERIYGPYPQKADFVTVTSDEACRPCYRNFKHNACDTFKCLDRIKPADVTRHIDRFMEDIKNESHARIPGDI
ncbi:MAG: lipopolysaccharide heptosyltransferase II [Candidatus Omnitrophica bacterium]|nr:lipopolysaccharide heptosyltransferase II [Candidatus Omnitrophota bacterium]